MTGTSAAAPTRGKVVGRIAPRINADALNAQMIERLSAHPLVIAALARADSILSAARVKATNEIGEAFGAALRSMHNERLRTTRQM